MNKECKVKIILKSGYEIPIKCTNFTVKYNPDTSIQGFSYEGLNKNTSINPMHINVNEIAAIIECP